MIKHLPIQASQNRIVKKNRQKSRVALLANWMATAGGVVIAPGAVRIAECRPAFCNNIKTTLCNRNLLTDSLHEFVEVLG